MAPRKDSSEESEAGSAVMVPMSRLPLIAACFDQRGRLLEQSPASVELFRRWPDLMDRFVAEVVSAGVKLAGVKTVVRGGSLGELHMLAVIKDGTAARWRG